jgi:hypothetical protein
MAEGCCEAPGCSMPGTTCPVCEQCLCWQHLDSSSCDACRRRVEQSSFEYRLGRLVGVGLCVLLCGILIMLSPHDAGGIVIQLALTLLIAGALLLWLGLIAHT